jgi:muramoyltetrapeptide carboxypeptidase
MGYKTLHAVMPITVPRATKRRLKRYANLFFALAYDIPTAPMNKIGKATGELVGGNLSILYSLSIISY